MKKIFLTFLIVTSLNMQAQPIRTFVAISGYRDADFNENAFGSLSTGLDFKVINSLRPEIELEFMYESPETRTNYNEKG